MQDKVNSLTSENLYQKTRVRELEAELRHKRAQYDIQRNRANEAENPRFRRSSPDSGFGSVEDSDEALERQKATHAKDRMSTTLSFPSLTCRIGKSAIYITVKD